MANPQMSRPVPVVKGVLENNALLALHSNLNLGGEGRAGYARIIQTGNGAVEVKGSREWQVCVIEGMSYPIV